MVQINFALKEVNCKVVYYGPGLSGKTTNLEVVHSKAPRTNVGELTSIATEGDRTLFFDFLPLNLGSVAGMTTKFQIYTVPGQVYYNSTRKLVLQGADGIVFVADSRRGKMDENLESLGNLEENLREYGMDPKTTPIVLQYNKRDLPDVYTVAELEEKLNRFNAPHFEAVAVTGEGVFPTLKKVSQMVLESLNKQQGSIAARPVKKAAVAEPAATPAARERVAVPVGAGAATARAGAVGGGSRDTTPPSGSTAPGGAATRGQRPGVKVVREAVSSSPGVKAIERKKPAGGGASPRSASSSSVQVPAAKGGSKAGLLVVLALLAAGAAAAALYFTGVLKF